jgi:hypothetical protein
VGALMTGAMKDCPICGESILAVARKCRYCGEYLDPKARPGEPTKSRVAVESGKLALLSLFPGLGILFGVFAVICGGIGLWQLKRHPGLEGKSDAWQGIIIGGLLVILQIGAIVGITHLGASSR